MIANQNGTVAGGMVQVRVDPEGSVNGKLATNTRRSEVIIVVCIELL